MLNSGLLCCPTLGSLQFPVSPSVNGKCHTLLQLLRLKPIKSDLIFLFLISQVQPTGKSCCLFQTYPKSDRVSPSPWLSTLSGTTSCLSHCKSFRQEPLYCSSCSPTADDPVCTQCGPAKLCIRSCDYADMATHHEQPGSQSLQEHRTSPPP